MFCRLAVPLKIYLHTMNRRVIGEPKISSVMDMERVVPSQALHAMPLVGDAHAPRKLERVLVFPLLPTPRHINTTTGPRAHHHSTSKLLQH
jgi:hypothetical protein